MREINARLLFKKTLRFLWKTYPRR